MYSMGYLRSYVSLINVSFGIQSTIKESVEQVVISCRQTVNFKHDKK